jgi:hypothetical protein
MGVELMVPGNRSATSTVPAAVPSLFHSSTPTELFAVKNRMPLTFVRLAGKEKDDPGLMSFRRPPELIDIRMLRQRTGRPGDAGHDELLPG